MPFLITQTLAMPHKVYEAGTVLWGLDPFTEENWEQLGHGRWIDDELAKRVDNGSLDLRDYGGA
jgi:hypothetical protein